MAVSIATQRWLEKAAHDRAAAHELARRRGLELADIVCFHCQQAAEKYLKAVLIQARFDFPKTHDLEKLIKLVKSTGVGVDELIPSAKMLTPFATDARYSSVGIEQGAMEKAIAAMERFREVFLGVLGAADTEEA